MHPGWLATDQRPLARFGHRQVVSELRVSEDAERLRAVLVFDPWLGSVMGQAGRRFQGMGVLESS